MTIRELLSLIKNRPGLLIWNIMGFAYRCRRNSGEGCGDCVIGGYGGDAVVAAGNGSG